MNIITDFFQENITTIITTGVLLLLLSILYRFKNKINDTVSNLIGFVFSLIIPILFLIFCFAGAACTFISGYIEYEVLSSIFAQTSEKASLSLAMSFVLVIILEGSKSYLSLIRHTPEYQSNGTLEYLRIVAVVVSFGCTAAFMFKAFDNPNEEAAIKKIEEQVKLDYKERIEAVERRRREEGVSIEEETASLLSEDNISTVPQSAELTRITKELASKKRKLDADKQNEISVLKASLGITGNISDWPDDIERVAAQEKVSEIETKYTVLKRDLDNEYRPQISNLEKAINTAYRDRETRKQNSLDRNDKKIEEIRKDYDTKLEELYEERHDAIKAASKEARTGSEAQNPYFASVLKQIARLFGADEYHYGFYMLLTLGTSLLLTFFIEYLILGVFNYLGKKFESFIPKSM